MRTDPTDDLPIIRASIDRRNCKSNAGHQGGAQQRPQQP